jgi:hypothetical protein
MALALRSRVWARRMSAGASGRVISTVPEIRTPSRIGVMPNIWSRLPTLIRGRTRGSGSITW